MKVNNHNNFDAAPRGIGNRARSRWAPLESDTALFACEVRFDRALEATPIIRPEVVSRAKKLIGDPNYPSSAQIEGIAALLARKLDPGAEY